MSTITINQKASVGFDYVQNGAKTASIIRSNPGDGLCNVFRIGCYSLQLLAITTGKVAYTVFHTESDVFVGHVDAIRIITDIPEMKRLIAGQVKSVAEKIRIVLVAVGHAAGTYGFLAARGVANLAGHASFFGGIPVIGVCTNAVSLASFTLGTLFTGFTLWTIEAYKAYREEENVFIKKFDYWMTVNLASEAAFMALCLASTPVIAPVLGTAAAEFVMFSMGIWAASTGLYLLCYSQTKNEAGTKVVELVKARNEAKQRDTNTVY